MKVPIQQPRASSMFGVAEKMLRIRQIPSHVPPSWRLQFPAFLQGHVTDSSQWNKSGIAVYLFLVEAVESSRGFSSPFLPLGQLCPMRRHCALAWQSHKSKGPGLLTQEGQPAWGVIQPTPEFIWTSNYLYQSNLWCFLVICYCSINQSTQTNTFGAQSEKEVGSSEMDRKVGGGQVCERHTSHAMGFCTWP